MSTRTEMTDQEIVATFMEPLGTRRFSKGRLSNVQISDGGWWTYTHEVRDGTQRTGYAPRCDSLDALHEVEERLSNEQWIAYDDELRSSTTSAISLHFGLIHATPFQKIRALATVLRGRSGE